MWHAGSTNDNVHVELKRVNAGYHAIEGFKSIRRKYVQVLNEVSLRIRDGERVAIIGESGSGKTTLLKVMLGLLQPVSGEVWVLGQNIYNMSKRDRWRITHKIGYVPQDPFRSLNPRLKVMDIVTEPLERSKFSERERVERVSEAFRMVQLHESILNYYPSQLSGGMMQRVLIARSIVHDPEMILLDEPTSALDVSTQAQIISLLNSIQERLDCTMITVTHDLPVAQYLADRVVILHGGSIVEEGDFEEVVKDPKSEHARRLILSYTLSVNSTNIL